MLEGDHLLEGDQVYINGVARAYLDKMRFL